MDILNNEKFKLREEILLSHIGAQGYLPAGSTLYKFRELPDISTYVVFLNLKEKIFFGRIGVKRNSFFHRSMAIWNDSVAVPVLGSAGQILLFATPGSVASLVGQKERPDPRISRIPRPAEMDIYNSELHDRSRAWSPRGICHSLWRDNERWNGHSPIVW